jgi:hypothetical protein
MKSGSLYQPPPRFRWPDDSKCCVMLWGFIPENCEKVFDLWWQEFAAMYDYGCCFVLTLHPWLSGRPSRVRLLERLVRSIQQKERTWFAVGGQIATYFQQNPDARHEIDFDREEVAKNNVGLSLIR